MKGRRFLVVVPFLALAGWWWTDRLGDLSFGNRGLVRRNGTVAFDSARWRGADEAERGRMLADLMRSRRFVGSRNDAVVQLLGPGTCYLGYGDEPCYPVILDGRRHQVEFWVNHSD